MVVAGALDVRGDHYRVELLDLDGAPPRMLKRPNITLHYGIFGALFGGVAHVCGGRNYNTDPWY